VIVAIRINSSLGWPHYSDAYDSGAAAVTYWLGSTLKADGCRGCPEMTWGRALKKALKCKGLPVNINK